MTQQIDPQLKTRLLSAEFRPALTLWNRLEGRARKEDFDRSLRAEIRDPLWMLTRQWQVGEFKGEDAGSAAKARVQVNTGRIDRFAVKSENAEATGGEEWLPAVGYDTGMPLEAQVERLAPGFRERIIGRHSMGPAALEAHNANEIGGDIAGGSSDVRQLFTRPVPSLTPWATPDPGIFLCSSSTVPGGGVHGMCGWHAAHAVLHRHGLVPARARDDER